MCVGEGPISKWSTVMDAIAREDQRRWEQFVEASRADMIADARCGRVQWNAIITNSVKVTTS